LRKGLNLKVESTLHTHAHTHFCPYPLLSTNIDIFVSAGERKCNYKYCTTYNKFIPNLFMFLEIQIET